MATVFAHTAVALSFGRAATRKKMPLRFWVLSVVCSCLPDADVIAFAFGIPYGAALGHRGFSHSIVFAALVGIIIVSVWFSELRAGSVAWWKLVAYFFVLTGSHGVIDAATNGGLGIAFLSPFDLTRYFLPWRPIQVSPIGPAFFSERGLRVLTSELIWIGPLCVLLLLASLVQRLSRS